MAKKLEEMTGWELSTALVELAEPVGNLVNDDQIWDAFVECTKGGVVLRRRGGIGREILQAYARIVPLLLKEHRNDTFKILSILEGKDIDEVMQMPGSDLLEDVRKALVDDGLISFFISPARSGKTGSSSR